MASMVNGETSPLKATLGELAGDALKGAAEAVHAASEPHPEDLPTLENGQAAPPRAKRKYTKKDAARWGSGAVAADDAATASPARTRTPAAARKATAGKSIKLNLAKGAGEGMVKGIARFPIIAADVVGTIATKGKFQLMDYVQESQMEECDRTFQETLLGGLELEIDAKWAWLATCGLTVGSAIALAGVQYAIAMKQSAGRIPAGRMPHNGNGQPGVGAAGQGVGDVLGQSPGGAQTAA